LGCPGGIGLGLGSVLLLKVSGSILRFSPSQFGWVNLAYSKKKIYYTPKKRLYKIKIRLKNNYLEHKKVEGKLSQLRI
jgi:hypothetical protein